MKLYRKFYALLISISQQSQQNQNAAQGGNVPSPGHLQQIMNQQQQNHPQQQQQMPGQMPQNRMQSMQNMMGQPGVVNAQQGPVSFPPIFLSLVAECRLNSRKIRLESKQKY